MTLREMKIGDTAIVKAINGGRGIHAKLEAMGLREGVKIIKKSTVMSTGPVIIEVGSTQIAIGAEMAKKIIV